MMKKCLVGVVVLAWLFGFPIVAMAGEPSCRNRLIKLCDEDDGAAICRLLRQDKPETQESIAQFLRQISHLDTEVQQDLICARLMGRKQVKRIYTQISNQKSGEDHYVFSSGMATWELSFNDPRYGDLVKAHEELNRLKLDEPKKIKFDIEGLIVDADATYSGRELSSFRLQADDVSLARISTPLAGQGDFEQQVAQVRKIINRAYDNFMKVGLESDGSEKLTLKTNVLDMETYTNSIGMEFVLIPAGEFQMGSNWGYDAEKPVHSVYISRPFYIGRYEVTQSQWQAVMGTNPSQFKGGDHPVENVSWIDVQQFVNKLNARERTGGYRLPTEAEWEYACRAKTMTPFNTGRSVELDLARAGWYGSNSGGQTHPVGQKEPNAWGVYDMHGNVWEWCHDWYGSYPAGHVTDPQGPNNGSSRVLRGGWYGPAGYCRSAGRGGFDPSLRRAFFGFRLALPQVSK
jgi:formylglycine-generating enzyme required for sulfatase activity